MTITCKLLIIFLIIESIILIYCYDNDTFAKFYMTIKKIFEKITSKEDIKSKENINTKEDIKSKENINTKEHIKSVDNINPLYVGISYINSKKSSNQCLSNSTLYPINSLEPNYGSFLSCDSCTQYIQSP